MIGLTDRHQYFVYVPACDMRKGFDGLSGVVMQYMERDPTDGSVYMFMNRRRDRMKMLVWEQGGFMLYYKRLEQGTFDLPKENREGKIELSWETLIFMIRGIKMEKIVRKKRYKRV